jgi:hypothetical protein
MGRLLQATDNVNTAAKSNYFVGDCGNMPAGLFAGMCFTTTSESPIYIKSLTIKDSNLSVVFSQGGSNGSDICAYADMVPGWTHVVATVDKDVLAASIETAYIPMVEYSESFSNLRVSPLFINVVSIQDIRDNVLVINQDNYSIPYDITEDMGIVFDSPLKAQITDNGEVIVGIDDVDIIQLKQEETRVIITQEMFSEVNGVSTNSGIINIDISIEGERIPARAIAANWVELDTSGLTLCPEFVDTLDSYIAPDTHEGYLPLNDMYDKSGQRDTVQAELFTYGKFSDDGKIQSIGVSLFDVDPNVDCVQ